MARTLLCITIASLGSAWLDWFRHLRSRLAARHSFFVRDDHMETLAPLISLRSAKFTQDRPAKVLFEEFRRFKPSLESLGVGFSVSRAKVRMKGDKCRKPPYFACCYNVGDLGDVNIVAFSYPLISDWNLMDADINQYRKRIHSALREEMIHAVQVLTVKKRYERSAELRSRLMTRRSTMTPSSGELSRS
jgi:hypothetical protein